MGNHPPPLLRSSWGRPPPPPAPRPRPSSPEFTWNRNTLKKCPQQSQKSRIDLLRERPQSLVTKSTRVRLSSSIHDPPARRGVTPSHAGMTSSEGGREGRTVWNLHPRRPPSSSPSCRRRQECVFHLLRLLSNCPYATTPQTNPPCLQETHHVYTKHPRLKFSYNEAWGHQKGQQLNRAGSQTLVEIPQKAISIKSSDRIFFPVFYNRQ